MKRIVAYCRVSTQEQAVDSHALDQQISRVKDAGAVEIFADILSGTKANRKQFKRLKEAIKDGDIDEVVVTRVDRIARSVIQVRNFAQACLDHGVNLKILDQSIDLSTPHGKLMLNMLSSVAEWEVDLLRDRVVHGIKHMQKEGRVAGVVPFGYRRSHNEKYEPDDTLYKDTGKTRWEVAQDIVHAFLTVGSVRGACRELEKIYGVKDPGTPRWHQGEFPREIGLKYWLENPVLRGHTGYYYRSRDKEVQLLPNTHQALISPDMWEEIQKNLSIHTRKLKKDAPPHPLAGLVYCGRCGGKYKAIRYEKGRHKKRSLTRWYCNAHHTPTVKCDGYGGVRNEVLENIVIAALIQKSSQLSQRMDDAITSDVPESPELQEARSALAALEMMPQNQFLEESKKALRNKIVLLEQEMLGKATNKVTLHNDLSSVIENPQYWEYLRSTGDLRRTFRKFVEKIVVREEIEVKLLL